MRNLSKSTYAQKVATGLDWLSCFGHGDTGACGAAAINTVSLGIGGGALKLSSLEYDGLSVGTGINSLAYGGIGYGLDINGFIKSCQESRNSGK